MFKDTKDGQTHYSCDVALKEGNGCCGCNHHDCVGAGAEGFLSQPENTLNVIKNAKKDVLNELIEFFKIHEADETWIIQKFKEMRNI
jgi:hypothetical protein